MKTLECMFYIGTANRNPDCKVHSALISGFFFKTCTNSHSLEQALFLLVFVVFVLRFMVSGIFKLDLRQVVLEFETRLEQYVLIMT